MFMSIKLSRTLNSFNDPEVRAKVKGIWSEKRKKLTQKKKEKLAEKWCKRLKL